MKAQANGAKATPLSDVYGLGAVLYECLAGQAPFERDGELAVMHAHLVQPPPLLPTALAGLSNGLDAVIAKAMAKSKDERYATCGDVIAAARQGAFERKASSLSTGASPKGARPGSHFGPRIIASQRRSRWPHSR